MVLSTSKGSFCSLEGPLAQVAGGQFPVIVSWRSEAYLAGSFPSSGLLWFPWLSLALTFLELPLLHLLKDLPTAGPECRPLFQCLHPPFATPVLSPTCPHLMILFLWPERSLQQWLSNFSVQAGLGGLLKILATLQPKVTDTPYLDQGLGIHILNQTPRGFYLTLQVRRPQRNKMRASHIKYNSDYQSSSSAFGPLAPMIKDRLVLRKGNFQQRGRRDLVWRRV